MSVVSKTYSTFRAGRFYFWSYEETVFGDSNQTSAPQNMVLSSKNMIFNKGMIGERQIYVPNTYVKLFRSYPVTVTESASLIESVKADEIREIIEESLLSSPADFLRKLCKACGFSIGVSDSSSVATLFGELSSFLDDAPFKALINDFDPVIVTNMTPAIFFQTAYSGLGLYVVPTSIDCNNFTIITPSKDSVVDNYLDCNISGISTTEDYSRRAEYFTFSIDENGGISRETPLTPGVSMDIWNSKPSYATQLYGDNSHSTAIGDNYIVSLDNKIINYIRALIVGSPAIFTADNVTTINNSNQAALGVPANEVSLNGESVYAKRFALLNYLTSAARFDNILESTLGEITCHMDDKADSFNIGLFQKAHVSSSVKIGLLGKDGQENFSAEIIIVGISLTELPGGITKLILKCGILGENKINKAEKLDLSTKVPVLSTNPT